MKHQHLSLTIPGIRLVNVANAYLSTSVHHFSDSRGEMIWHTTVENSGHPSV